MGAVGDFLERLLLRRSQVALLRVVGTERLTPHMLRVEFEGDDIAHLADDANLHVRLLLPPHGALRGSWLAVDASGRATGPWQGTYRKYTIRRIDPAAGRLWIDFVLHGDSGPGSAWAERAAAGDVLGVIGPGGRSIGAADWYLIGGDETALPAIARILETLASDATGRVVIEVADAAEEQNLAVPPGMALRWLHRQPADSAAERLADAVIATPLPSQGRRFVWVAAEHETAHDIRTHLRAMGGFDKTNHLVVAYWRRGERETGSE